MYSSSQLTRKYIHYFFTALNGKGHGMHSPFVFDFILSVLNNKHNYRPPKEIKRLKAGLKRNNTRILVEDLGAGSRLQSSHQKRISLLATTSVKPKKYGELLFRLAKHYQPQTIVELGTSLGMSTSYLASANTAASVVTIEGSKEIYNIANKNFETLGLSNIQSLNGNFDHLLSPVIDKLPSLDLAYIDGNHRYTPTISYFNQMLQKTHNNTILVFDDIHWSKEMENAWQEIKAHPSVRCTVDIFFLGFVFFRQEFKEKQDFTIRF